MRSRGKRLNRQLLSERPQPRDEFVSTLAHRLTSEPVRRRAIWRTAVAAGFTMLLIVAFALTGGIGYAANAVEGGTTAVTSLVTGPQEQVTTASSTTASTSNSESTQSSSESEEEEPNGDDDDDSSADDEYEDDVLICHHPPRDPEDARTIRVDADEVARHLAHGDTLGPCPDDDDDEEDDD
jgi:cytoskeletal protein RodZ